MQDDIDFNLISKYYDIIYQDRDDDIELWLSLSEDFAGDILEIGCGTGRVSLPLLQAGKGLTGVDISELALSIVTEKSRAAGVSARANFYQADMRAFDLPQKDFSLAFIPINSFMHNLTTADQQRTLKSIAEHLQPDGAIVVDLYHPYPQALAEADGRMQFAGQFEDEASGNIVQWFVSRQLDLGEQIQQVTFMLDEIDNDGMVRRRHFSFPMRYLHRFEMELLLTNAGFELLEILGDYDGSEFYAESPRMIFIARKNKGNVKTS